MVVTFLCSKATYGPLQGLLNSFCPKVSQGCSSGSYGFNMYPFGNHVNGYSSEGFVPPQSATEAVQSAQRIQLDQSVYETIDEVQDVNFQSEYPPRIDVDQSGYESSESSVYDILSDDDEYNKMDEGDICAPQDINNQKYEL
jgi:hypothetical protein